MSVKPTLKELCRAAAVHFGIGPEDLLSESRFQIHAWPRQVVMFLGVEMLRRSTQAIGTYLRGRDHTTVLHGCRTVERAAEGKEVLIDLMTVAALATSFARTRYERNLDFAQELHAGCAFVALEPRLPVIAPKVSRRIMVPVRVTRAPVAPRRLAMPSDLRPPTRAQLMGARA